MNRTLSIWNELRPYSVGFDNIFDHFSNTLEFTHSQNQAYPPYNINKVDELNWQIEMALAGFSKTDIEVAYADNQLTIKSTFEKDGKEGSGVIAQELEKVAPELVNSDSEYKAVAYGNIVGYLIEAIKELEARVKELENK
jgi:HSP20 family molecular chaperone IbpA